MELNFNQTLLAQFPRFMEGVSLQCVIRRMRIGEMQRIDTLKAVVVGRGVGGHSARAVTVQKKMSADLSLGDACLLVLGSD